MFKMFFKYNLMNAVLGGGLQEGSRRMLYVLVEKTAGNNISHEKVV